MFDVFWICHLVLPLLFLSFFLFFCLSFFSTHRLSSSLLHLSIIPFMAPFNLLHTHSTYTYIQISPHSKESPPSCPLWSGTNKNRDVSTGPLACPFARSLALLTRLLAPDCSLRSRPPLRSLVRSLAHFANELACGTDWMAIFSIFDHSRQLT